MNGDKVLWPANGEPGFLSQQRCPALWELGARPGIKEAKANKIIEDIITCANVSASSEHPTIDGESSNIYLKAYHELVLYLRFLFIYYNNEIKTEELQCVINDKWAGVNCLKDSIPMKDVKVLRLLHIITIFFWNGFLGYLVLSIR